MICLSRNCTYNNNRQHMLRMIIALATETNRAFSKRESNHQKQLYVYCMHTDVEYMYYCVCIYCMHIDTLPVQSV